LLVFSFGRWIRRYWLNR